MNTLSSYLYLYLYKISFINAFDFDPSISIGYIGKVIKSQPTQRLWNNYELKKYYWKRCMLWPGEYFACTVGDASRSTLEYYIANQGKFAYIRKAIAFAVLRSNI